MGFPYPPAAPDPVTDAVRRLRLAAAALPAADQWTAREHLARVVTEIADTLDNESGL